MKKQSYSFSFLIIAAFAVISCSSNKTIQNTDVGNIPSWFKQTPEDPNYFFAAATAVSKDLQLAVDKATTDARAEIARQVELRVNGLQKKFDEEVGTPENSTLLQMFTQANKTVVSTSLSGSKVAKKEIVEDGDNFRVYVLVQYPIGATSEALMQQIKNKEELYTRYRASQAFKELDEEVKKYEEWKKSQTE